MPYTFAHIGFIIPFQKKWERYFSATGLVFGCIAPDYDILFRFTQNRFHIFTYDILTILLFIYPLAFVSAVAFHLFCRTVVINYLPDFFQYKYEPYQTVKLKEIFFDHFFKVSFSILFAIFLHLFLDCLCHYFDAYSAKIFILKYTQSNFLANTGYLATIYLLPILFTIIGFILLYKFIFSSALRIENFYLSKNKMPFWLLFMSLTIAISVVKICLSTIEKNFIIDFFAITFTSSIIFAFYFTCGIYFILNIKSKKSQ